MKIPLNASLPMLSSRLDFEVTLLIGDAFVPLIAKDNTISLLFTKLEDPINIKITDVRIPFSFGSGVFSPVAYGSNVRVYGSASFGGTHLTNSGEPILRICRQIRDLLVAHGARITGCPSELDDSAAE